MPELVEWAPEEAPAEAPAEAVAVAPAPWESKGLKEQYYLFPVVSSSQCSNCTQKPDAVMGSRHCPVSACHESCIELSSIHSLRGVEDCLFLVEMQGACAWPVDQDPALHASEAC